jgi:hypothetical protein
MALAVIACPNERRIHMMTDAIEKDIRLLKIYAGCSTLAFTVVLFAGFQSGQKKQTFDEIDVQRINIVDNQGHKFLVLANKDRFPLPVVEGKEYPRSINPSGIVFYDDKGTECGGIAVASLPGVRRTAIIFDYSNSEAIGFSAFETKNGKSGAGMSIQDRNPVGSDIMKVGTEGTNRISLENDNKNAEISLSDGHGKKRIRLLVDSVGTANIEFLNAEGKVISSLPQK